MKTDLYNQHGEIISQIDLPDEIFGLKVNNDLVHQAMLAQLGNSRQVLAHTKDRSEVRGGGKKPWRQKGLGKARHGSIRSPIWVGGGVAHGPRKDKDYSVKINAKAKKKAFFTVLSQKLRDNEILFLDKMDFSKPKTKEAIEIIDSLSKIGGFEKIKNKKKNKAILALEKKEPNVSKSFRNIPGMEIYQARNLNILDILNFKYLVIANPKEAISGWK